LRVVQGCLVGRYWGPLWVVTAVIGEVMAAIGEVMVVVGEETKFLFHHNSGN